MKYLFLLFPIISLSQNIYIPDPVLKDYFVGTYGYHLDTNFDGEVSQTEALTLTHFVAGYFYMIGGISNITDFTGLEHFTNLQSIQIVLNQATFLDLSNLSNLKTLQITGVINSSIFPNPIIYNPIASLNLNGCTALEYINIDNSSVQTLDLTTNIALKEFYANETKLEHVNFSGLSLLQKVEIQNGLSPGTPFGFLQNATFSGNNALTNLNIIKQPNLQVLDLTDATSLTNLNCYQSGLNILKIQNLSNLIYADCKSNQITDLDLSGLSSLEKLYCEFNQIKKLDFSGADEIKLIYCNNNLLDEFIVSPNTNNKLAYVDCSFNKIKKLDFSNLGNEFKGVDCKNNLLTEINVKGTDLRGLDCSNNNLILLDLEWVQNLVGLDCSNNQISYINMKNVIANPYDSLFVTDPLNYPTMNFENNPIFFACVDDFHVDHYNAYFSAKNMNGINVDSTCEFEPIIYPNPVDSLLNIRFFGKVDSINVYNINGQLVLNDVVNDIIYSKPIDNLLSGVYFLEAISNNSSKTTKFIKN